MADFLLVPVAIVYVAIVLALLVFGLNFSYLTWTAIRQRNSRPRAEASVDPPFVTVQIPVFNERYVATRVIEAAAGMRYPRDRYEIQVLDDSDDDTSEIVADCVERLRSTGLRIEHIRRADRQHYKAGALRFGMTRARGEYIAFFDADFAPAPDFLERAVPVLDGDLSLAFVQGRWSHLNRSQSLLTRVQALSIDGHFGIEQQGRWAGGHCFNFNGTAGVWRRSAIVDAGGWSGRSLTEDLDLSYRAHLRGWRAAYVHDLEVPAELPVSFMAYRRQQHRWARGSLQCAARLIPELWRSDLRLSSKVEGTLHLGGYVIHLLLVGLVGIFPAVILMSRDYPTLLSLFGTMAVLNLAALAPSALFLSAQHLVGRRWYASIPVVILLTLVGVGMMVNTTRAAIGATSRGAGVFVRTPKFGADGSRSNWRRLRYQGSIDPIVVIEGAVVALCLWTAVLAWRSGSWAIAAYASIFAMGLTLNALLTIWQTLAVVVSSRMAAPSSGRLGWPGRTPSALPGRD